MPDRWRPAATATLIGIAVLMVYGYRLDWSPIYLKYEEVYFALEAHSIATTGHDTHGRFMPVYFQVFANNWYQPVLVYFLALFLKVLPLTESAIRWPSAVAGTIDVVLMYLIGRRLFRRESPAVCAALLLALTPAHVIESRVAMDYLYPVPFMLGWLLCLTISSRHAVSGCCSLLAAFSASASSRTSPRLH